MNSSRAILFLVAIVLILQVYDFFAAGVSVRVFESRITGGYVYCRTGSLPNDTHIDRGQATVSTSQTVDCPT